MTLKEMERGFELHEQRMARILDNFVLQGELLNRLEQRIDRIAAMMEEDRERLRVMQVAMTSLFERLEGFVRRLKAPRR